MKRVFGLETEYGITVSGAESVDVVAESIELVRCYTEHGALMKWDYELEDPHLDARGFRARELLQDTDESAYYEIDKNRPLSFEEIKSDLVLSNGARFYNDHAHPEYSTPECTTLRQIIAQDKAGERILAECARRRNQKLPSANEVRLYKNNTARLRGIGSSPASCHFSLPAKFSPAPERWAPKRRVRRVSLGLIKSRSGQIFSACW
ncbi:MAG: hypothetical protein DME68_09355 [Verrucomicrobia bacterium]|nr:MAG: hypothetical protein DME68_09355 [Verrucomicrobiota bacterium]